MAIGTRYRLSVVARHQATLHVNTWWFLQIGNPPLVPPSQHLIDLFIITAMPLYRTLFPGTFNMHELSVWLFKGSPENLVNSVNINGTASFGGILMPTQVSSVVTWTTGIAGRRFRGRSYFGALQTGVQIGQTLSPLYLDKVTQFARAMVEDMDNDGVFNFVIWSKANETTSKVTGWTLRTGLFTQRRRTAAYGE